MEYPSDRGYLLDVDLGAALLGLQPQRLLQLPTPALLLLQPNLQQLHLVPEAGPRSLLRLLQPPHVLSLDQAERRVGPCHLETGSSECETGFGVQSWWAEDSGTCSAHLVLSLRPGRLQLAQFGLQVLLLLGQLLDLLTLDL